MPSGYMAVDLWQDTLYGYLPRHGLIVVLVCMDVESGCKSAAATTTRRRMKLMT